MIKNKNFLSLRYEKFLFEKKKNNVSVKTKISVIKIPNTKENGINNNINKNKSFFKKLYI